MRDFKKIGRTLVSTSIIATTMVWSVGLVAWPSAASAAACPQLKAGQLVRFGNAKAQVSYMGSGNRWTFLNNDAFVSWRGPVAVKRVDAKCAGAYPEAGVIGFRPGSRLVTNTSAGGVFAVGPKNTVHKLSNSAAAKGLYGAGWQGSTSKLSNAQYGALYTAGSPLDGSVAHDGMLVKKKGDKATWYVWGGELKMINGKLPAFLNRTVRTVAPAKLASLAVSSGSITAAAIIADPTQGALVNVSEAPAASAAPASIAPEPSPAPAKTETVKVDTEPGTVSQGLFHNANYTGSFPAPEGLVLKGTYGNDKFQDPTGSGVYRYQIQTAFERPIVCLDSTRLFYDSKGGSYDAGFQNGFAMSEAEAKSIKPIFNDTPVGPNAGKAFYNEAYKAAYFHRWNGGGLTGKQRNCPQKDFTAAEFAKYDTDGWYKNENIAKLKTVRTLYTAPMVIGLSNSSQSALGGDSTSLNLDNYLDKIEGSSFSTKTGSINLSRIDFLETDTSAEELALGPEGIMRVLFDQQSAEIKRKYANTVAFINLQTYRPVLDLKSEKPYIVETQTYGKNKITVLQYITAKDGKWNLSNYGLRIDPKTNTGLLFFFYNPKDISNETKNGIDTAKASSDFLAQLLTKMEFANY